jgi:hypothetical protein
MQSVTTGMMHTTGTHAKKRVVGNNGKFAKRATMEFPGNGQFARNARLTPLVGLTVLKSALI